MSKPYICIFFLVFSACIEPIELDIDNEPGILVVEGVISNSPGPHRVKISRTAIGQRVPIPESGAEVVLHDDQGNTYSYFEELPGIHVIPFGVVNAYPGISYHIELVLSDGSMYESAPERMAGQLAKDTVYYDFVEFTEINENSIPITTNSMEIYLDSNIPSSDRPLYYRWVTEEAYQFKPTDFPDPFGNIPDPCFFFKSLDPQRINLFNSLEERGGKINQRLLARRDIDASLLHRYFIVVNQFGLTQEAYTYWDNVRKNIEQTGSIFDIPPATVIGNIKNFNDPSMAVYGYFGVSPVAVTRTELNGDDVPNFINDPCEYVFFKPQNEYPRECINCTEATGNVDKPQFF